MREVLAGVDIFRSVPLDELIAFAQRGRRRQYRPGACLMRQGEPSESLQIILSGRVRIEQATAYRAEPIRLAELGPGEVVGEIGLLLRQPRSAMVTAIEPTETIELSGDLVVEIILHDRAVLGQLLQLLDERRRRTRATIQSLTIAPAAVA